MKKILCPALCLLAHMVGSPLSLAQDPGRPFSYTIHRPHFTCYITYRITGENYIKIKRVTNGKVDYLILQDLQESDAPKIHELVTARPEWFKSFMPSFIADYGTSITRAKNSIRRERGHKLAIFHQATPQASPRLIGIVGYHSEGLYDQVHKSVDGMYALGHPAYIQVKGAGLVAIQALFNLLLYKKTAGTVVLVIHQDNVRSLRIARKLKMKETRKTHKHTPWPYAEAPHECHVFHLTAEAWKALHWDKA